MAPLLNAPPTTPAPPTQTGKASTSLPALRKELEGGLPAQLKDPVNRVVTAGMKILYSPEQRPKVQAIYDRIAQGGFQPQQIATGMTNLMTLIFNASKRQAPIEALYPASTILLTYVLEDLQKTRGLTVTKDLVTSTSKLMAQTFMQAVQKGAPQSVAVPPGGPPPEMPPGAPPGMPPPAPSPLLNRGM